MIAENKALLQGISDAVLGMEEDKVVTLVEQAIKAKIEPLVTIESLTDGIERAGKLFVEEEYFVPELLLCSDAMYAGLELVRPYLDRSVDNSIGKVVIGVIEGDTHDIGKNLVKILLDTAGFEIIDLGRDVPPKNFVDTAIENKAQFIALSTLMTTTMGSMEEVVKLLKDHDSNRQIKVIIGGGPISQGFADRIGAQGYAANAVEAARLFKRLSNN
jgi:corrinoid protein of di/trimethylamine methyltransferase